MLDFNENTNQALINLHIVRLIEKISEKEDKSTTEIIREFMASKTYDLLVDRESYLYLESPAYILDMLNAEKEGDWNRWLEI